MKKHLLLYFLLMFVLSNATAQKTVRLYQGKAPGSEKWDWQEGEIAASHTAYNVVDPTLTIYLPDSSLSIRTAVLVCPGGGFHLLGMKGEGTDVAKWLNAQGIAAFILKYRLVRTVTSNPVRETNLKLVDPKKFSQVVDSVVKIAIADGVRAMEYIKQHATEYGIAPNGVGIMGFSAGGTTAMGVGCNYTKESRPDFLIAIYPYLDVLKNQNVPSDAPPVFICAATDDPLHIASQSADLYSQWIAAGKSAELHLYAKGGHGFGLGKPNLPVSSWTERLKEWLDMQGYISRSTK